MSKLCKLILSEDSVPMGEENWERITDVCGVTVISHVVGENPLPWDCCMHVDTNEQNHTVIVLEGGAGECGYGSCVVKVPVESFNNNYDIEVTIESSVYFKDIYETCAACNWKLVSKEDGYYPLRGINA